jgi:hypothetical protein
MESGSMTDYDPARMERSQRYVDRAVRWINECVKDTYASPIIHLGPPDQGDALSWRVKNREEKYWFRTIDAKEAHSWTGPRPPDSWGGLMLATEHQVHQSWVYIVINEPMTCLAHIDMTKWNPAVLEQKTTRHPESGEPQESILAPFRCFNFVELKK